MGQLEILASHGRWTNMAWWFSKEGWSA